MKYILLALFACSINNLNAQRVRESTDKFTKQRRLESGYIYLKGGELSTYLSVKLRSVDTTHFLVIAGRNLGAGVIGNNSVAMFLLANDSTISVLSTGVQDYDIGSYRTKTYQHQYHVTEQQLLLLSSSPVKSVRRYLTDVYVDIDVPKKNSERLMDLSKEYLNKFKPGQ